MWGENMARFLVGFASSHGSTKEVAEFVANTLLDHGVDTDTQALKDVKLLTGYSAVIIGAPLIMFRWHKDARTFLKKFRKDLSNLPSAVFALGPISSVDTQGFAPSREQLNSEIAKFSWFEPRSMRLFGGRYDPTRAPLGEKLYLDGMQSVDLRNWDDIRAWAESLVDMLSETV
jgi:menaquinone-dependent protoporphyrinogen oxidase